MFITKYSFPNCTIDRFYKFISANNLNNINPTVVEKNLQPQQKFWQTSAIRYKAIRKEIAKLSIKTNRNLRDRNQGR